MDWSTLAANASGGETVGLSCSADGPGLSLTPHHHHQYYSQASPHQAGMALEDGDW